MIAIVVSSIVNFLNLLFEDTLTVGIEMAILYYPQCGCFFTLVFENIYTYSSCNISQNSGKTLIKMYE